MRKEARKGPRTKKRYVVCLARGNHEYRSNNYKTERGAMGAAERMRKKYGPLCYEVTIEVVEEVV